MSWFFVADPIKRIDTAPPTTNYFSENRVPNDLLRIVYSYLNGNELVRFGSVDRHLYSQIFFDRPLWNLLLQKYFPASCARVQSDICRMGGFPFYRHLEMVEHNIKVGKFRLHTLLAHKAPIKRILIDGVHLISLSDDNTIKLWNFKTGKEERTIIGHLKRINCILIHANQLVTASDDCIIRIWNLSNRKGARVLRGHRAGIISLLIHENWLISSSSNGVIKVWDFDSGQVVHTLAGHQGVVNCIFIHKNKLFSAADDLLIKIWNLESGKEVSQLEGHRDGITSVSVEDDQLISASENGEIKIWDLNSGIVGHTFSGHGDEVLKLLVNGDHLISTSEDRTIKIWDLKSKQEVRTFSGYSSHITCTLIHGSQLITASGNEIQISNFKTGEVVYRLAGHLDFINTLLVRRNLLISSSDDCKIKIWDLGNGKEVQTLKGHRDSINNILMHEDCLISTSIDGVIKIWDFSFPPLSSYSKQLLEDNLIILKEMAHSESLTPEMIEKLAEQLDPDFKTRLKHYAICSVETILRVQTEIYVELLLHEIHGENWKKVAQLADQIVSIDFENSKLYELLEKVCNRKKISRWGEYAFHNIQRFTASLFQKEEAVVAFKRYLYERKV